MRVNNFSKGILTGLAVGSVAAFAASKIQPKHMHMAKKALTKAAKNIGDTVSDYNPLH